MSTAEELSHELAPFEGLAVVEAGIEIPGAAGGLRDALHFAPLAFHHGETVVVVLKCAVSKIRHEPVDKNDTSGDQKRVHVLGVDEAAFIDESTVAKALADTRKLVEEGRRREEEERGISRLAFDDDEAALGQAHAAGDHKDGLVDGCPVCAIEQAAVAAEEADGQGASISKLGKHRDG